MKRTRVASFVAVAFVACEGPRPIQAPPGTPDDIRQACALATRKCSGCHELDRIVNAHHNVRDWQVTVDRMRAIPGSAISEPDAAVIVSCLAYINSSAAM